MKRSRFRFVVLFSLCCFAASFSFAQSGKVPPFKILQPNGVVFGAQNLPLGKPILLVYFSPDCDHCEKMLQQFFQRAADFQKASVAFITYLPVGKVAKFAKDYGLARHANMYAGTEGTSFFVRNYYRIQNLPFVALYTKNGDLVSRTERDIDWKALAAMLKRLP